MAQKMTDEEWRAFVSHGTRTGKLSTVRADGSPHVAPIWFLLDGDDVVFNTGEGDRQGTESGPRRPGRPVRGRRPAAVRLRRAARGGPSCRRTSTSCGTGPRGSAPATWARSAPRSSASATAFPANSSYAYGSRRFWPTPRWPTESPDPRPAGPAPGAAATCLSRRSRAAGRCASARRTRRDGSAPPSPSRGHGRRRAPRASPGRGRGRGTRR